jgi:hypothetical protein
MNPEFQVSSFKYSGGKVNLRLEDPRRILPEVSAFPD